MVRPTPLPPSSTRQWTVHSGLAKTVFGAATVTGKHGPECRGAAGTIWGTSRAGYAYNAAGTKKISVGDFTWSHHLLAREQSQMLPKSDLDQNPAFPRGGSLGTSLHPLSLSLP